MDNKAKKEKPKLLTPQEKFAKMNEKNPKLLVLKKEFNLQII